MPFASDKRDLGNMKLRDELILLCIPALISAGGMTALAITAGIVIEYIILDLLFIIGAALINSAPFMLLLFIHFRRVRNKTGPRNCSFFAAYSPAVLVMLAVILLVLREVSFGRPGTQFAALTFFFSARVDRPHYTSWLYHRMDDRVVHSKAPRHLQSRRRFVTASAPRQFV